MIHLERPAASPEYLLSDEVEAYRTQVRDFFRRGEKTRRQERPDFPFFRPKTFERLMADLLQISHGKCAYCESPIEATGIGSIDRFRPKAGAIGLNKEFSSEHYWWLAYEWENLYPACATCNKLKGPSFPVEGPRAVPETAPSALTSERRLLVDPFADEPEKHFDFLDSGQVRPRSSAGEVTIATLELNRSPVIAARRHVARETRRKLVYLPVAKRFTDRAIAWAGQYLASLDPSPPPPTDMEHFRDILNPSRPQAAVARAVFRRWLGPRMKAAVYSTAHEKAKAKPKTRDAPESLPLGVVGRFIAHPDLKAFGATAKSKRLSAKAQHLRTQVVTRVEIRNLRGIRDLDLHINYERGVGSPWLILLGENGTGKSSILQAVALALTGPDGEKSVGSSPKQLLRQGAAQGWVKVWLGDTSTPRVLGFRRGQRRFRRHGQEYLSVLLGYGATRLLPHAGHMRSKGRISLENMFDPFRPLLDADRWLGHLDQEAFDYVARALKDVLSLPHSCRLRRIRRKGRRGVSLKLFGTDLALDQLSDGYQSVLGLTCDIIAGLRAESRGALEAAEGLVAIDELGAHLHPRWRMRIVASLRKAFPRVQFLVSTHDPLCLRGLEDGEAVVLRRTARGRVFAVPDLPPIKGLRVDQLLTSEYFGLDSTMDPEVERKYRELYRLLALRNPTTKQVEAIGRLRDELKPYDFPGATRRERRLLAIIDQQLAREDEEPDQGRRSTLRAEGDQRIANDLNRLLSEAPAPA